MHFTSLLPNIPVVLYYTKHCLQLSASSFLKKKADSSAIIDIIYAMIIKALLNHVLFLVECNILVPIPSLHLSIIVSVLQLLLSFCRQSGHMVMAKKSLMDVEVHSLTILGALPLFHMYICIHVNKNL